MFFLMDYLINNWSEIVGIAGAVHLLALAIVNLTPTPKDDEIYGKAYKVIEKLAGIFSKVAKQWLPSCYAACGNIKAPGGDSSISKREEGLGSDWLTQSRILSSLSIVQKSCALYHSNQGISDLTRLQSAQAPIKFFLTVLPPFDWGCTWSRVEGFGLPQYPHSGHFSKMLRRNRFLADLFCKHWRLNTRSFSKSTINNGTACIQSS